MAKYTERFVIQPVSRWAFAIFDQKEQKETHISEIGDGTRLAATCKQLNEARAAALDRGDTQFRFCNECGHVMAAGEFSFGGMCFYCSASRDD